MSVRPGEFHSSRRNVCQAGGVPIIARKCHTDRGKSRNAHFKPRKPSLDRIRTWTANKLLQEGELEIEVLVEALKHAGIDDSRAYTKILSFTTDDDPTHRLAAFSRLADIGQYGDRPFTEATFDLLERASMDSFPDVRAVAVIWAFDLLKRNAGDVDRHRTVEFLESACAQNRFAETKKNLLCNKVNDGTLWCQEWEREWGPKLKSARRSRVIFEDYKPFQIGERWESCGDSIRMKVTVYRVYGAWYDRIRNTPTDYLAPYLDMARTALKSSDYEVVDDALSALRTGDREQDVAAILEIATRQYGNFDDAIWALGSMCNDAAVNAYSNIETILDARHLNIKRNIDDKLQEIAREYGGGRIRCN